MYDSCKVIKKFDVSKYNVSIILIFEFTENPFSTGKENNSVNLI